MTYILDTNICIYIIKRKPESVVDRLQKMQSDQLAVSTITVAELEYGVRKSAQPEKNQLALQNFLMPLSILNFDFAATLEYGIIRSELERKGTPIGPLDLLIAAHAKSLGHTLVTNNEKEFSRIDGLHIENWVK
ncbi:MAG TPA: type II toxin-antitoxin system VapC family toxin [Ohtaekwangia sp.]|uniref:type II toxin-antitoxin system tRNA(fMet)-specific endonuclease VapC n=1 Tax=Ohtaekwangia sp. TaxID=2066019 RepID=UPI002F9300CF